jgi:hypothetical protein
MRPQPPLVVLCIAPPGVTDRLAWETGGKHVHALHIVRQVRSVVVDGNVRPMLRQHALAILITLAHPCNAEPSALQP